MRLLQLAYPLLILAYFVFGYDATFEILKLLWVVMGTLVFVFGVMFVIFLSNYSMLTFLLSLASFILFYSAYGQATFTIFKLTFTLIGGVAFGIVSMYATSTFLFYMFDRRNNRYNGHGQGSVFWEWLTGSMGLVVFVMIFYYAINHQITLTTTESNVSNFSQVTLPTVESLFVIVGVVVIGIVISYILSVTYYLIIAYYNKHQDESLSEKLLMGLLAVLMFAVFLGFCGLVINFIGAQFGLAMMFEKLINY